MQFYGRPINSIVGVTFVQEMPFPAITLCNYNQIRGSKIDSQSLSLFNLMYSYKEPGK